MSPKPRPNHRLYLEVLQRLSPEQKLRKVFELSEFAKGLFLQGLRNTFPNASEEEFQRILVARLAKCHNRSY